MSFITGTNMELLYASTAAGTAKNTFTSEVSINDTAAMGPVAFISPNFFAASGGKYGAIGKSIRIVARGILGCTTGSPTFTFSIRFGAAANTTSAIVLGTPALTMSATALTAQPFELEGDVVLETLGAAGTNSTVRGLGQMVSPIIASQATGQIGGMSGVWGGAASPGTVATVDTTITNYVNFNVACSASNAANGVTLQQLLVFGMN